MVVDKVFFQETLSGHLEDTRKIQVTWRTRCSREIEETLLPHDSTGQEMGDGMQIHFFFHTPVKVLE